MLVQSSLQRSKQGSVPEIKVIQVQQPSPGKLLQPQSPNHQRILFVTRSNTRNSIKMSLKAKQSGSLNSYYPMLRSNTINYDVNEEINMKEIYKEKDEEENAPKLLKKFLEVTDCSILKYGLKPSSENIEFSYCRTCDPNLINPICAACINICHKTHKIKKKYIKGEIKCICGERLHCMSKTPDLTNNNNSCQLGEWYIISKLNFYYKLDDNNKCLCMLCYNFCNKNKEGNKIIKLNENDNIPECSCNNEEIHQEKKIFFEKIDKIANNISSFEFFNLLHPSQIINMIFLSKKQFEINYINLIYLNNIFLNENFLESSEFNSFIKTDFSNTICCSIFKHLLNFINWNKYNDITYFCNEACNYFSFKMVKSIISIMEEMKYNEKSFWVLSGQFLKIFHKIYIGNLSQSFAKFKLNDLENFSSCLRWSLSDLNQNNFPESQEIINTLILFLTKININGFSNIEALETIEIIITIFRKMGKYNLISNADMVKIVQEIDKILLEAKKLRKNLSKTELFFNKISNERRLSIKNNIRLISEKELKLYYMIIKIIFNFNLTFNDRLINSALLNNSLYPNLESINPNSIVFSFVKSELGRALVKLTIRVLYTLQNEHFQFLNDKKFKKIMDYGMKIIQCFLLSNDSYLLSIIQSLNNNNFYEKINSIDINNDNEYQDILEQKKSLETAYYKYFNFENDIFDVLNTVKTTLNKVLDQALYERQNSNKNITTVSLNKKRLLCIIKSTYYFSLSKFFRILDSYNNKKKRIPEELIKNKISEEQNEELNYIIKRIYLFYRAFIHKSNDNSLILLSFYIFKDLCISPIQYSLNNFELFLKAIHNIINNFSVIESVYVYINNLFEYLEFLRNNKCDMINECFYIFMEILELLVLHIKSLDLEERMNDLRALIININEKYKIMKIFYDNKANLKEDIKFDQCLLSYMKLVNNIFDFTNEENKYDAINIVNSERAIYALKYYNINLKLRTEFLIFIRKINIDLSYNKSSNKLYTNSIINVEDNLVLLKTNPLITNFRYPTRLLSYFKDFVNLSVRTQYNEQKGKSDTFSESSSDIESNAYTFKLQNKTIKEESQIYKSNNINTEQRTEKNKDEDFKNDIKNINIQEELNNKKDSSDEESDGDESKDKKKNNNNADDENEDNEDLYENNKSLKSDSSKKILIPVFDIETYDVLMNELQNLNEIIADIKVYEENEMQSLSNYFENGLLIPIIFFLKKSFVFGHCFSGKEMLKLYELIIESCNLKLFISEYKHNFWEEAIDTEFNENNNFTEENIDENDNNNSYYDKIFNSIVDKENFTWVYNNKGYQIDGNFCMNPSMNEMAEKALNTLQKKKFLCFDFTSLYNIFEKNLLSLLKDRKENNYRIFFNDEEKVVTLKVIEKEEANMLPGYKNMNDKAKRIIRLYMIYSLCKKYYSINENNSSLFSILPDLCLEYETNFRNLLITFLVNNGEKCDIFEDKLTLSFSFLYKLLNLQTSETQITLINLIGGNDTDSSDLGFMSQFSKYLFKKIILLFIELFNPPDKLLDDNYVFSFLLIKIFKFLCEEHNNFFQCRLIKTLNYEYTSHIPMYYKEVSLAEESEEKKGEESQSDNYTNSNLKKKSIKFFDFFLHVILKIILISEWSKLDYIEENIEQQNTYLYDIFAAILEMLNEIIQGSRPEFLNNLGNSILDNEANDIEQYLIEDDLSNNKAAVEYRIIEKVDSFQFFVKNVTDFIFSDRVSLELLYKIRNDLMQFFITILEEKNCNEEIQKFIIKYLNINRVFNTISSILKNYYVMELKNDENNNFGINNLTIKSDMNNSLLVNYAKTLFNIRELSHFNTGQVDIKNMKEENESKKLLMNSDYFRDYVLEKNKFIFNEKLLEFYRDCYFDGELNQSNEFQLSNVFYKYIKLIAVLNKSDEAKNIIEQAEMLGEEAARRKFGNNHNNIEKKDSKKSNNALFTDLILKRKYNTIINQKTKHFESKLNESEFINFNLKDIRISKLEKAKTLINSKNQNHKKKEEKFNSLINENANEVEKDVIEHYYIIKFFESITKTIEVRTEEAINQTVIFTKPPEMEYLSQGTKVEFEREVNRDSETSKKNDLITHVTYFLKEINYYQNKQSSLSRWISKIDFLYIEIASYIYFLIFNLLTLFTLKGDININYSEQLDEVIEYRRKNSTEIKRLINNSLYKWQDIYNMICYIGVFINGFFILVWTYFRLPLYFQIDRLKYMKLHNIQKEEHLSFFEKIYIIIVITIYERGYILTLIFEFIFSLIGAILKKGEIIYAFLLLPIIDLNKLVKNIIVSVKLFYGEVALTFFFMVIIIFIFSNFAFFFFNEDYKKELAYTDDNLCKTLTFCFLNAMDSGLRARGGIGDSGKSISFIRHQSHYLKRIILDDFFFILIVITAIDLVFGIIIRAFANLRDEEQKHENDKKNHCFICHVNKNSLEKNRQNFEEHRNKIHYLWNYVDYMITLKFSDIHDLNAINSYTSEKLANKDISWLPTYKDLETRDKNGEKNEFEEELKVEDENVNKYYVKTC